MPNAKETERGTPEAEAQGGMAPFGDVAGGMAGDWTNSACPPSGAGQRCLPSAFHLSL
jgi:hypothetical protein